MFLLQKEVSGSTISLSLRAVLAGAASPAPQFVTNWEDYDRNGNFVKAGSTQIVANGTTAVVLAAAPSENNIRRIKTLSMFNADNADATVSISIYDGTTDWVIMKAKVIKDGEVLLYEAGDGWRQLAVAGTLKLSD
jgi:hypothetical protein